MKAKRKPVIPKWYVEGSLAKTKKLVFSMMKKRCTDEQIGEVLGVKETTIRGFLTKKVHEESAKFRATLPFGHPRALNRCIRSAWLINDSRAETSAFITQQIVNGVSRTEIGEMITDMTGIKVTNAMVNSYIANHMNVNFTQEKIDQKLNEDNRFFSIHVIGSKPEALDKVKGVA